MVDILDYAVSENEGLGLLNRSRLKLKLEQTRWKREIALRAYQLEAGYIAGTVFI